VLVDYAAFGMAWMHYGSIDSLYGEYPDEFFVGFIEYGKEFATKIITEKQYCLFDPMISDWSCHLRAVWLCCLLKSATLDALTDEDFIFFGFSRLLSESAVFVQHDIVHAPLKTRTSYWPPSIARLNKTRQVEIFGRAKEFVAFRVLHDLYRWFEEVPAEYIAPSIDLKKSERIAIKRELLALFSKPQFISFSGVLTPMLPFFHGSLVVFSLAASRGIHCHNITRDLVANSSAPAGFSLVNSRIDSFCCENSACNWSLAKSQKEDEPSVIVETYRFHAQTDNCKNDVESFLKEKTTSDLTYVDFIYLLMATHELFPNRADSMNTDAPTSADFGRESNKVMESYKTYGNAFGIRASRFISDLYYSMVEDPYRAMLPRPTLFDISHIKSGSLLEAFQHV
jgi:hypothetical protein